MTQGNSAEPCSHWSATLDKYWRSSRPDLWSTLNVAIAPALSGSPELHQHIRTENWLTANRPHSYLILLRWVQFVIIIIIATAAAATTTTTTTTEEQTRMKDKKNIIQTSYYTQTRHYTFIYARVCLTYFVVLREYLYIFTLRAS